MYRLLLFLRRLFDAVEEFFIYFNYHKKWKLNRNSIVMDLGSGNNPIMRANLLVEKYMETTTERTGYQGTLRLIKDRTFVCADAEYLPFKDKSIDFIHCSQLLEHIVEPEKFLKELERVSKRGLITSIRGEMDKLTQYDCHLWFFV